MKFQKSKKFAPAYTSLGSSVYSAACTEAAARERATMPAFTIEGTIIATRIQKRVTRRIDVKCKVDKKNSKKNDGMMSKLHRTLFKGGNDHLLCWYQQTGAEVPSVRFSMKPILILPYGYNAAGDKFVTGILTVSLGGRAAEVGRGLYKFRLWADIRGTATV
jgi:hypothetical protein